MRLIQASSATAVLVKDEPWKRLQVLAGQTVVETPSLSLPAVTKKTRFLIQWIMATNQVIGRTDLLVYPPGLLKDLKPLLENQPLGILDPGNQLRPVLEGLGMDLHDLGDAGWENFTGKLAIIGSFTINSEGQQHLMRQMKKLLEHGVAVVWLQPPRFQGEERTPSFYTVQENGAAITVVAPSEVSNLPENPKSQLNLIYFAQLALHPKPNELPLISSEP